MRRSCRRLLHHRFLMRKTQNDLPAAALRVLFLFCLFISYPLLVCMSAFNPLSFSFGLKTLECVNPLVYFVLLLICYLNCFGVNKSFSYALLFHYVLICSPQLHAFTFCYYSNLTILVTLEPLLTPHDVSHEYT